MKVTLKNCNQKSRTKDFNWDLLSPLHSTNINPFSPNTKKSLFPSIDISLDIPYTPQTQTQQPKTKTPPSNPTERPHETLQKGLHNLGII